MSEFTFLTKEQIDIYCDHGILSIIGFNYGNRAFLTDFSILLGGCNTTLDGYYYNYNCFGSDGLYHYDRSFDKKSKIGSWWTKSSDGEKDTLAVNREGPGYTCFVCKRDIGARPALPYSSISSTFSNVVRDRGGIKEVLYGEYPQTIVDENYSCELEGAYNNGSLRTTGKKYTTDSVRCQDYSTNFRPRTHTEYEYSGSKYIRFVGDENCDGKILSDGRTIQSGNAYWVRVEPITWIVDEIVDIALSKKIIFSGVQFQNCNDYESYDGDFDRTNIKQFMDNYFSKEIITEKIVSNNFSKNILEKNEIKNNYFGPLDEKISYYTNLPIEKVDNNIISCTLYGQDLSELSMFIADEFTKLTNMKIDKEFTTKIEDILDKLNYKAKFSLFQNKLSVSKKIEQNKLILDELKLVLDNNQNDILQIVKHFEDLKKLIAVYIYRLNGYIGEIEKAIGFLGQNNKNENSLIVNQILSDRLRDIKIALMVNTNQYKKINQLLSLYAINIGKIFTTKTVTLPQLYIEMSINDGILVNQESVRSISNINSLLEGVINTNDQMLKIELNKSFDDKNMSNVELTDELNESIKNILINENIMNQNDNANIDIDKPLVKKNDITQ